MKTAHNDFAQAMSQAIGGGPEQSEARKRAREILNLDEINYLYFESLFRAQKAAGKKESLKIFSGPESVSPKKISDEVQWIAYPIGEPSTPQEVTAEFHYVDYRQLKADYRGHEAKKATLLLKKLQAGTGSSMTRMSFLQGHPELEKILNLEPGQEIKIGAKGTDLLAQIQLPSSGLHEVSLVELQLLQALAISEKSPYAGLVLQDVVGPETQNRLERIWQKPSLINPSLSYDKLFAAKENLARSQSSYQAHVPSLDERGEISFARFAPAGHGLFAVDALRDVLHPEKLPTQFSKTVIAAIANGEDLNSLPDPAMIEWMVKTRTPIALVSTSKTPIDVKGGILCLVKKREGTESYLKVLDTAEAKAIGQLELFEKLPGFLNTNLLLFNYEVLTEKLKDFSEQELFGAMTPDLVPNWKEQRDLDGVMRKYLQLEGTMGSAIMNLDRAYRKKHSESLVAIINVDAELRTEFFSPIKSAFDYFLQFHSDRFAIDTGEWKLRHASGAKLPAIHLKDSSYQDVQTVLESFAGCQVRDLDELTINGRVSLKGFHLKGRVEIDNASSGLQDLNRWADRFKKDSAGRPLLQDLRVKLSDSALETEPLTT